MKYSTGNVALLASSENVEWKNKVKVSKFGCYDTGGKRLISAVFRLVSASWWKSAISDNLKKHKHICGCDTFTDAVIPSLIEFVFAG